MLAMPTGGAPTSAPEEETGVVADRPSDDLSTYDVSWNVLVGPEPDGGFGWQIWTEHSLWIPHAASGPERVKGDETTSYADWMSASRVGSLIHATSGRAGGVGGWWRNRAGFAA